MAETIDEYAQLLADTRAVCDRIDAMTVAALEPTTTPPKETDD